MLALIAIDGRTVDDHRTPRGTVLSPRPAPAHDVTVVVCALCLRPAVGMVRSRSGEWPVCPEHVPIGYRPRRTGDDG